MSNPKGKQPENERSVRGLSVISAESVPDVPGASARPTRAYTARTKLKRKRDLNEFTSDLQESINKVAPPNPKGYRSVAVLALSWENDTMGVKITEKELLDVLRNCYGFDVESYVIEVGHTSKLEAFSAIQARIAQFYQKWDGPDCLTIYIYSGHGQLVESGNNNQYLIAGRANEKGLVGPSLDWIAISSAIQYQEGDVLYIFDSHCASQIVIGAGPELLAAANWSSVAGPSLETSFTRVLAQQLTELDGKPYSVSHLYGMMHRAVLENKIAQEPLYVPHPTKPSIVLEKQEVP